MGATFSVLSNPGTLLDHCVTVCGVTGKLVTKYFSQSLGCLWGDLLFSHSFLIMPESPTTLLVRNLVTKLGTVVLLAPGQIPNCLPVIEADIDPKIWADPGIVDCALTVTPVRVYFKNPHMVPCWRQYPLKPEIQQELIPVINNLKKTGLLRTCNSPCNTPILRVRKPNGEW